MTRPNLRKRCPSTNRRGVAVVELAICMPVLMLVFFATIETCWMLQLKQNLTTAAFEGARIAVIPGTDASLVNSQCEMLMDDRNINNYQITVVPNDLTTAEPGTNISVTVSADFASNSLIGGVLFDGEQVQETITMRAE